MYTAILAASLSLSPDAVVAPAGTPSFHLDAEIDPTAYVLSGYSLHLGLGHGRTRLDLGVFGMALPEAIHGAVGVDARFDGFGAKLHHFVFAAPNEQRGLFVGVDGGFARAHAKNASSGATARADQLSVGAHVGYRITLPWNLYVTPWIGVSYAFGAKDLHVGDRTLSAMPWTIFPAVHLGYRFL